MKVERHKCEEKVYSRTRSFYGVGCTVNAKYFENEKWYCHHHAPSQKKVRMDAQRAEWNREQEVKNGIQARAEARRSAVLAALEGELSTWDIGLETRHEPHFTFTGNIWLSPTAVNQLLIKLGIDPKEVLK